MQQQGYRCGESTYVGGYKLAHGRSYYLYVTKVSTPEGNDEAFQTFVVDTDSRILVADAPQIEGQ